jgi:DNA-binding transcriptional regulator GbsR (MarR family)
MAQIHALLMVSERELSTDEVMGHLRISRGNANTNLRELVSWGLVRRIARLGERREFFEAEKESWKIFCNIARERKRREIEPLVEALERIRAEAALNPDPVFTKQLQDLLVIVNQASAALDRISQMKDATLVPMLMRALDTFRKS